MRLIDADALLKKLDDSIWYNVADFNEAWYAVDHAPTVEDVPVRHGRWEEDVYNEDSFWRCTACGFASEAHAANLLYKFCPNCGADMREDGGDGNTD